MTKAEAIAMLKRIQEPEAWEPQITQAAFEALDMAIKALEQQPCEDTISRQAAIEALENTKEVAR
jgi:predicted ABC-type ATPase